MKQKILNLITALCCLIVVFSFVSCGGDDDVPVTTEQSPNTNVKEETAKEPESTTVEEIYWKGIDEVYLILKGCYMRCENFVVPLLQLEGVRTDGTSNVHSITPRNILLNDVYSSAYGLINIANSIIFYAPSLKQSDTSINAKEIDGLVAEAKCLRSFTYYNLAMLWGNVILITEPINSVTNDYPTQSNQVDVYKFAYNDVCDAVEIIPDSHNTDIGVTTRFVRNTGLMLKAEIELTLGYNDNAQRTLLEIENEFSFDIDNNGQNISIYTPNHKVLYSEEANGDSAELEKEWANMNNSRYGYWAALKRLGKAQEVTMCYDYELLMPFYYMEILLNNKMVQNPGYETDNYSELKEREKNAISNFILQNNINVISESQFNNQNKTTNASRNEYVLLAESGVYMQIIQKGYGSTLQSTETKVVNVRFSEQNMLAPSLVLSNLQDPSLVDKMTIMCSNDEYTASFTEGLMYSTYGSSVPNGWLKPFPFIKLGNVTSMEDAPAKVKLIVPHSQGHSYASANVIPYFYEIAFR